MSESVTISYYICDRYQNLLPKNHEILIREVIKKLHDLSFYALTYEKLPGHPEAMRLKLLELMNTPGISPAYKAALQDKIKQ